jgi:hypothetical protein
MGNCIGVDTTAAATGDSFVDVLFFPEHMPCKNFHSGKGCTRKNCKGIHDQGSSLLTMIGFLKGANKTMDICVFTITCDEVSRQASLVRGAETDLLLCITCRLRTRCSRPTNGVSRSASSRTTARPRAKAPTFKSSSTLCVAPLGRMESYGTLTRFGICLMCC